MQGMAVLVFLLWHMGLLQGRWRGKGGRRVQRRGVERWRKGWQNP